MIRISFFSKKFLFILLLPLFLAPQYAFGKTEHIIYFKNTDFELHVYKIYGSEKGRTLMIIGGIQGDEPGGYLAADLYVDMALRKGNLIVVPRANFLSIIKNRRAINHDMNRRFLKRGSRGYYEDRVVAILKGLMDQSDYLLNLHEGSGFYSDQWVDDLVNPMRFGQSIIADADVYHTGDGRVLYLGRLARKVAEEVNYRIRNKRHHFKFNNHRTFEKDTHHPEQRRSATFFALSKYHIPAFGIETSKAIKDLELKVRYQSMIINAFMKEFGIIPEIPRVVLDLPRLEYLVFSVNGIKRLVQNGEKLAVKKGDMIKVTRVEANYKRGLSVDLDGIGTANDLGKDFIVRGPVKVVVKKDRFKCGEIEIVVKDIDENYFNKTSLPRFKYLIVELNGEKRVLSDGEHLKVVRGDVIRLLDVITEGIMEKELKVNFLGFVGNKINNDGEDRGYEINTAKDLWVKYSQDKKGKRYTISINREDKRIGTVYVDIEEPKMEYIVLKQRGGDKRWHSSGESITVTPSEVIEVIDIKTNIKDNSGVKVKVNRGSKGNMKSIVKEININSIIKESSGNGRGRKYEIIITREGILFGKLFLKVSNPIASLELP